MLCCGSSAKDAVVEKNPSKKPETKNTQTTTAAKAVNNNSTPTTATTTTTTTSTTTPTTASTTPASATTTAATTPEVKKDEITTTTKSPMTMDNIISSTIANESKLHSSSGKEKDVPLEKRKSGEKSRIKTFEPEDTGAVRESMKIDGSLSPGTRILIAPPGDLSPNGTHVRPRVSSTTEAVHYLPTALVKPKGHRVRIEPSFNSKPVHLIVPPNPLLVASVLEVEGCTWAKVHPKMFPTGFKGCDTHCDGWTLIKDSREEGIPLVFWKKADE